MGISVKYNYHLVVNHLLFTLNRKLVKTISHRGSFGRNCDRLKGLVNFETSFGRLHTTPLLLSRIFDSDIVILRISVLIVIIVRKR